MPGLGTIINVAAIFVGGLIGMLFGKLLKERIQDALYKACGVCTIFLGIMGAIEGFNSMLVIACILPGVVVGELLNIDDRMEAFGEWLKEKSKSNGENRFVEGFVNASLTVCIGAMAIVGSIEDAINGDITILLTKAILDLIIIMVMTCSMGKGCIFSALPVAILQGSVTALAIFIKPLMTDAALANISMIGSILIACVGINLVWGRKIRVAGMLPAVIFAVIFAFTGWF